MGIAFDIETNYLFTIGEDGFLKVSDLTSRQVVYEEMLCAKGMKHMIHDPPSKRLFLGDGDGNVYIFSTKLCPPECIGKA